MVSKQEDNYHNVGFVIVVGDSQQQTTLCLDSSSPDANGMSYKHHKSVTQSLMNCANNLHHHITIKAVVI